MIKYYIPNIKKGKVIKVYDGDTITIQSKIPWLFRSKVYKFSIRLNGIDAPEIRTEKELAIISRDALSNKILHKRVKLKNLKKEKYGRILCDVYYKKTRMLKHSYAKEYHGGKK